MLDVPHPTTVHPHSSWKLAFRPAKHGLFRPGRRSTRKKSVRENLYTALWSTLGDEWTQRSRAASCKWPFYRRVVLNIELITKDAEAAAILQVECDTLRRRRQRHRFRYLVFERSIASADAAYATNNRYVSTSLSPERHRTGCYSLNEV